MSERNPYAPPQAAVDRPPAAARSGGSLEKGIAGEYDFDIGEVLAEAWKKVSGLKLPFWIGALVLGMLSSLLTGVLGAVTSPIVSSSTVLAVAVPLVVQLVVMLVVYPVMTGVIMMGVRRVAEKPIEVGTAFGYFHVAVPVVIAGLLTTVFISLGLVFFLIPGIYLSVAYALTIPLIADKGLGVWQAMEASRKAVTAHWFKVFGLMLVMIVILSLSAIPLLVGLIWTYPMMLNTLAIVYREAFGVSST